VNDWYNKVVLVTGASRGIGSEIVARFARGGATVFANHPDVDAEQHVQAIEQQREFLGLSDDRVISVSADVADSKRVTAMFAWIAQQCGRLDILINNAGINRDRTVAKMTDEEWNDVLAVNLNGTFFTCRAAAKAMPGPGRIVNIASVIAFTGNYGVANYAASKSAVLGLTRTLALELAPRQITINAVCPGFVDTSMTRGIRQDVLELILQRIPMRRLGLPSEIASCVLFLSSEDAAYITGHSICVDGGFYTGGM